MNVKLFLKRKNKLIDTYLVTNKKLLNIKPIQTMSYKRQWGQRLCWRCCHVLFHFVNDFRILVTDCIRNVTNWHSKISHFLIKFTQKTGVEFNWELLMNSTTLVLLLKHLFQSTRKFLSIFRWGGGGFSVMGIYSREIKMEQKLKNILLTKLQLEKQLVEN